MGEQLKQEMKELSDLVLSIDSDHIYELISEYRHYTNHYHITQPKFTCHTLAEGHVYALQQMKDAYKDIISGDDRQQNLDLSSKP